MWYLGWIFLILACLWAGRRFILALEERGGFLGS